MRLRSSAELQEQPFDAPSSWRNRRYQLLTPHGSSLDVPWSPPIRIENSGANASHDLVLVKVQVARTCASSPITDVADVRPLQSAGTVQLALSGMGRRRACERKHAAEQQSQEGVAGISREDLLRRDWRASAGRPFDPGWNVPGKRR